MRDTRLTHLSLLRFVNSAMQGTLKGVVSNQGIMPLEGSLVRLFADVSYIWLQPHGLAFEVVGMGEGLCSDSVSIVSPFVER